MTRGLIDVSMIVKNEQETLARTLASVQTLGPLLGKIRIYDTGSTDRTIAIARAADAHVVRGYWDDDFARARNAALALVRAPWALIVDADEVLKVDVSALTATLRSQSADQAPAFILGIALVTDGQVTGSFPSVRLIRPQRTMWRNRLHEKVVYRDGSSLSSVAVIPSEVAAIAHFGYVDGESMHRRAERNLRISELQTTELDEPTGYAHDGNANDLDQRAEHEFNHARTLILAGRHEEAITLMEKVWGYPIRARARVLAGEYLVETYLNAGRLDDLDTLLRQLGTFGVDEQFLRFSWARLWYAKNDFAQAWSTLRTFDRTVSFQGVTYTHARILALRAVAALQAQQVDDAIATGLTLVVHHGELGYLGMVVRLWAPRPWPGLAGILNEAAVNRADLLAALSALGEPGQAIQDELARTAAPTPR